VPFGRRLLIIDRDSTFRRYASHVLSSLGFETQEAALGRNGLAELGRTTPDCVIVDLQLEDFRGLDLVRVIEAELPPRPPVVAVSAALSVSDAVLAMKFGAKDAVGKPIEAERLRRTVLSAIERGDLAHDVARIQAQLPESFGTDLLVAQSAAMRATLERVDRVALVDMPVLIVGEKGSGKRAIARRLHAAGPRVNRPFVIVPAPAGTVPGAAEQALFGGAGRATAFAQAQDGVVFIESLASLGPSGQERLARVLADLGAARAGGHSAVCPRVIVGSDTELGAEVEAARVRPELARRLSPLTIHVPPLRERRNDIPELVRRIALRIGREEGRPSATFSAEVLEQFAQHAWPGNLRELEAAVIRAALLGREGRVSREDLGVERDGADRASSTPASRWMPTEGGEVLRFDQYEAEIFRFALKQAGGCVSRAAEMLGVGRATMYRKMRSYEIDLPPVAERGTARSRDPAS
jgi:two-component system response regulator HydG